MTKITRSLAVFLFAVLLAGCTSTNSPQEVPRLMDPYADLAAYWQNVSRYLGIDPNAGRLREWRLSYKAGKVTELRLVFYVERSPKRHDWIVLTQDKYGVAKLNHTMVNDVLPSGLIPAGDFFVKLNAVGYRALERNERISDTATSWMSTSTGTVTYGQDVPAFILVDGRIEQTGLKGVTFRGSHGTLQIRDGDTAGADSPTPPFYLIPSLECVWGGSNTDRSRASVWFCPGSP